MKMKHYLFTKLLQMDQKKNNNSIFSILINFYRSLLIFSIFISNIRYVIRTTILSYYCEQKERYR